MQLRRNHTHFESIQRICDCVNALRMRGLGVGEEMQIGGQIRLKESRDKLDYDCLKLRYLDKTSWTILVEICSMWTQLIMSVRTDRCFFWPSS